MWLVSLLPTLVCLAVAESPKASSKPHVLLLLADDYGWANWGIHNTGTGPQDKQIQAEIQTPNLDQLANAGIRLDRHYAFRICSPSRSSLMSGRLAMHVNWVNTGITFNNPKDPVSGSGGIPRNMTGMAAKLKEVGYRTHMVGKWDAGAATPQHTPWGRGFETFLGYLQHANDFWNEGIGFTSTGEVDVCMDKFVDFSFYNDTFKGGLSAEMRAELGCSKDTVYNHSKTVELKPQVSPVGCVNETYCFPDSCYEEAMLRTRALRIIEQHDTSSPLFLFYAPHLLHTPLQVPQSYLERVDANVARAGGQPIDSANRRLYAAMVLYLDDAIGEVVKGLKAKGMWDNTLIIFTSDNGGPVYEPGAANNHPLKGGKYSDWEGGIRTNAFVSGGFIPAERRGSVHTGVVSIADWYGTLATIAGGSYEDKAAEEANVWLREKGLPLLPPVDSVPQWPHLLAGTNGRADTLYVSNKAVLRYPWKLVASDQVYSRWFGQQYPNCSTISGLARHGPAPPLLDEVRLFGELLKLPLPPWRMEAVMDIEHCGEGKLFNVEDDPGEHTDLSGDPQRASILADLRADLKRFNEGIFQPDRGKETMEACWEAMRVGGFYGPFVDSADFFSKIEKTPKQIADDVTDKVDLEFVQNVLLPSRAKQIAWFVSKVGNLSGLVGGGTFDRCLVPSEQGGVLVV